MNRFCNPNISKVQQLYVHHNFLNTTPFAPQVCKKKTNDVFKHLRKKGTRNRPSVWKRNRCSRTLNDDSSEVETDILAIFFPGSLQHLKPMEVLTSSTQPLFFLSIPNSVLFLFPLVILQVTTVAKNQNNLNRALLGNAITNTQKTIKEREREG